MAKTNPTERAKELHGLIESEKAKNMVTIAVLTTDTATVVVGTNERRLRSEQKEALTDFEIEAKSEKGKHAEENAIAKVKELGLKGKEMGASRPICSDCHESIEKEGIATETKLSGKPSKNRQR